MNLESVQRFLNRVAPSGALLAAFALAAGVVGGAKPGKAGDLCLVEDGRPVFAPCSLDLSHRNRIAKLRPSS